MESTVSTTHVVMVPFPAQSHLNQLLNLSTLISSYGGGNALKVYFLGTETHNRQAKLRSGSAMLSGIQFHSFPTPPIPAPDPEPRASDKNRVPMHLASAAQAYMSLGQSIAAFVQQLASSSSSSSSSSPATKRVVVIYDGMISAAVRDAVKVSKNVESYAFNSASAFHLFYTHWDARGRPFQVADNEARWISKLVPPVKELMPEQVIQYILSRDIQETRGEIHNTSRVFDDTFLQLMERMNNISTGGIGKAPRKKQWAMAAFPTRYATNNNNSLLAIDDDDDDDDEGAKGISNNKHKCLEWLDKQEPRSVMYVSFGTLLSLSEEEVREIATGLEQSRHKFLWVLRDADRADIFAKEEEKMELLQLPHGFEERVGESGRCLVVRDWAPQLEILGHESVGGFMTHCGWNSCYESMSFGVPIAAWPVHSDQLLNAIFLTQVLRVGIMVRERGEPTTAAAVKDAVERLIAASEERDEVRKNAEEMSAAIEKSWEEDGRDSGELKEFVAHITR